MGKKDRIQAITTFIEENSTDLYRETWEYQGGGSDSGNQEQAAWLLLALKNEW